MAEIKIAVLIRESPYRSNRVSELLRMSVGLTIVDGNRVALYFLETGADCLARGNPEESGYKPIEKHLRTLGLLKCPFYLVQNQEPAGGMDSPYAFQRISDSEFARRLIESDRTIG